MKDSFIDQKARRRQHRDAIHHGEHFDEQNVKHRHKPSPKRMSRHAVPEFEMDEDFSFARPTRRPW